MDEDIIKQLLADRRVTHGTAWLISGEALQWFYDRNYLTKIFMTPHAYAWVMILAKLIRITQNPNFTDNWKDIEGYARLVRESLEPPVAARKIGRPRKSDR